MSYVIDAYRGKFEVEKSILPFATYVSMFPQLIAGPIVNYREVRNELRKRKITRKDVETGMVAFTIGLSYKVILANQIGTVWNGVQTVGVYGMSTAMAWVGAWSYSFQLLFDFAGYSMMAIGLGRMMGFYIPINFADPYVSRSATEFWRRWHITLGRWFKDYVYIPLGGNRKGKKRMIFNLFVVWALTGLWHGASWNFVIWGIMFFVILMVEKVFLLKYLDKYKVLSRIYMLILIPVSWMVFAITDIKQVILYIARMFFIPIKGMVEINTKEILLKYIGEYWWMLLICAICATPLPMKLLDKFYNNLITKLVLLVLFWISIYLILVSAENPFLYFRF
jgi:alginate O-acetyltransferase complex protein AlgI